MPSFTSINSLSGALAISASADELFSSPYDPTLSWADMDEEEEIFSTPYDATISWAECDDEGDQPAITPTTVLHTPSTLSLPPVMASSQIHTYHSFQPELETIDEGEEDEETDSEYCTSESGDELLTPVLLPYDFATSQPPMEAVMELLTSVDHESHAPISSKVGPGNPLPQPTIEEVYELLREADSDVITVSLPPPGHCYEKVAETTLPRREFTPFEEDTPQSTFEIDQALFHGARHRLLAYLGIPATIQTMTYTVKLPTVYDTPSSSDPSPSDPRQ